MLFPVLLLFCVCKLSFAVADNPKNDSILPPDYVTTEVWEMASHSSWKNAPFFQDIVAEDLTLRLDELKIVSFEVSDATLKDSGHTSIIHRVLLNVELLETSERKLLSYAVKEKSNSDSVAQMAELVPFSKEIDVYSKFLPVFERMWETEGVKFGPRMFKIVDSQFTVLVMEDLKMSGFHMRDSRYGLNLDECKQVLEKIAKFHASSVVYLEQHGSYSDEFKREVFSENKTQQLEKLYALLFNSYLQALAELQLPEYILEALNPYKGKVYSKVCNLMNSNITDFNVLNHGDIWVNNLLFSESDVKLLDYQTVFLGSPYFDLLYFIINSASFAVRTDSFDYLVDFYYNNLKDGLNKLKAKTVMPTKETFMEGVKSYGILALVWSMDHLALALAVTDSGWNVNEFFSEGPEGEENRQHVYRNALFVDMITQLLPFMWERGFFNGNIL